MDDNDDVEDAWNKYYEDYVNGGYTSATSVKTGASYAAPTEPYKKFIKPVTELDFDLPNEYACTDYVFTVGKTYSMFCAVCGGPMTVRMISAAYDTLERCKEVVLARLDSQCDCPLAICVQDTKVEGISF